MATNLKPGTYRLKHDVVNPEPDRRFKNDWRFFAGWKAGTEFLVVGKTQDGVDVDAVDGLTDEVKAKLKARLSYVAICLVGYRWSHNSIGPGHGARYEALCEAFEPIAESHEALFTRLGVHHGFAQWLVTSGKFTPAEFEQLWDAYYAEPEKPNTETQAFVADSISSDDPINQGWDGPAITIPEGSDEL